MTKFQVGLIVGFFLGALSLFMALGIIYLFFQERRPPSASASETSSGRGARADSTNLFQIL
jgi:hypothetical protein